MKTLERATTDHVLRYYQIKLPTKTAVTEYGQATLDAFNIET
jgi:hypothetical protein